MVTMGTSKRLGVSSRLLSDQDLNLLADHQADEDLIFDEIRKYRGMICDDTAYPKYIHRKILHDEPDFLISLYPGKTIMEARSEFSDRLDRCLVSALSTLVSEQGNIIETGTFTGFTTALITHGLEQVQSKSILFTIDLPTSSSITQIHHINLNEIGILAKSAASRVVQVVEDAKLALPRLLSNNRVEMFIHDSLHTITHMTYEYIVARAFMPENSILVSDDILWNSAFINFVRTFELPFWVCNSNPNYGIALNLIHPSEKSYAWGPLLINDYIRSLNR